ncbi:hypothetical protein SELMODRAFT_138488 [Selaginella moellendorffii]|uniref:Ribosomal RNA small subunit methyltransferase G n=1 Tax=Selaginella moellendorffii TaxID=88036 RepID=D8TFI1_SELML|nr:uncharacterized protein LOC9648467 [Selaginella moellendorffii]XP_024523651.1 uncharacterized protein LOC9648467 [Selaginella moellendorffii]EFJ04589.1 hypothetical protein SELMODRAFT_138488 [Selaginella moellendorffii]|eukprot:XP_002994346.1 uncharacterized protein LOC9648467 [Selaginella moellendorffii]
MALSPKLLLQWKALQGHGGSRLVCFSSRARVFCENALDPSQSKLVSAYIDKLLDWNQRMNLTSVTDRKEVMERHIRDSLSLLPVIEKHCSLSDGSLKVVDIGSGAGLPGIIFGIARPSWKITLIESIQKKCDFLEDAVLAVSLQNVSVVRARAEEKGRDVEFRETFDVAVARAVAEMRVLAELCLPFVAAGGIMVAAKGANPEEEVKSAEEAITLLGGSCANIIEVDSESPFGTRTAVVCLKATPTPEKYPRRPGAPSKRPLGFRSKRTEAG